MDSDDMDSDGTPDVDQFKDVYGAAQRRALRAASITPGVADEAIFMTVREGVGDLYFRVRGHQGAFAPGKPFRITATVTRSDVCASAQLKLRASRPPSAGEKTTLILTNTSRPSLKLEGVEAKRRFVGQLRRLAEQTDGFVYDLGDNKQLMAVYTAWDRSPRCVPQANAVVHSIRMLIEMFETKQPFENIVLVGADDVIPFLRIADRAEISRESQWTGPYATGTPLDESLAQGFFLSDDAYGTERPIDRLGRQLFVPTRAVGRLVETADDITKHIEWFVRDGTKGISLAVALVTGYTFVHDLGDKLAEVLAKASTNVDKTLVRDLWSANDLRKKLFGGPAPSRGRSQHHDLIAAQGHYSANTLVPADDGPRFRSAELTKVANRDFAGTIWATIGCHSGHDILDTQATNYVKPTSFAEALLALGTTVVAGTGYQYAESVLLKNSERLYVHFVEELTLAQDLSGTAYPDGVPIGRALINAKLRYRNELLTPRGMDEKIVAVATLYGLPHLRVHAPQPQPRPRPDRGPRVNVKATGTKGLGTAEISIKGFRSEALAAKSGEAYYAVDGQTIATPLRPVLPGIFRDVTVPGSVAIGAVWLAGDYTEKPHDPLIARPVTERNPRMPHYRNRAYLPARPLRLGHFEAGRQLLVFAPMQFRYDDSGGTARLWKRAEFKVYYSSRTDVGTLRDAPSIHAPRLENVGSTTRVTVDVHHYASSTEAVDVYATHDNGAGELRSTILSGGPSWGDGNHFVRRYRGDIPVAVGRARIFFQAVGDNGRVGTLSNGGRLFGFAAPGAPTASELTLTVPSKSAGHRDQITVEATLRRQGGAPLRGHEVLFRLGASRLWTKTDSAGIATATLTVAVIPRTEPYLIVATYPGSTDARSSAASKELTVRKAQTSMIAAPNPLSAETREEVCQLVLASRGNGLGERPVQIEQHGEIYFTYTDPDGSVRLHPSDLDSPPPGKHPVTVRFMGNDRYEPSTASFDVVIGLAEKTRRTR